MPDQTRQPADDSTRSLPERAGGTPSAEDPALASQGSAAEGSMDGSPDPAQAQGDGHDPSTEFGSSKSDMYRGIPGDRVAG